jgi:hypothetical protein
MNIFELEEYAQENGYDSLKFSAVLPNGNKVEGEWVDAYIGVFRISGTNGIITTKGWREVYGNNIEFIIK